MKNIPDNWIETPIKSIAKVITGKTPPTNIAENYGKDIPFITPGDLGNTKYVYTTEKHITYKGAKGITILPLNTCLFTCIGSTIGKMGLTVAESITNQQLNAIIANSNTDKEFLYYILSFIAPKIKKIAGVQAVPIINKTEFENTRISIPANEVEQRAIADILSTWDQAIEKMETLIEKKQNELNAYGRKIFSRENTHKNWQRIKLEKIVIEHGDKSSGGEKVYSVSVHKGLVNQIEHLGRSFSAANTEHYNRVHAGDIVYTKSPTGNFPYGIVKQSNVRFDVIVSPLYGVFTPKNYDIGVILDFYFESPIRAKNYLYPIIQKGAKNTINITNTTFLKGELFFPTNIKEQTIISNYIQTARNEISVLNQILNKYKEQKRGLMQKLLTGEWRVNV